MPFLSNTLMGMLNVDDSSIPVEAKEPIGTEDCIPELDTSNIPEDLADIVYEDLNNGHKGHLCRLQTVSLHPQCHL
jgi:hypothetical protein